MIFWQFINKEFDFKEIYKGGGGGYLFRNGMYIFYTLRSWNLIILPFTNLNVTHNAQKNLKAHFNFSQMKY